MGLRTRIKSKAKAVAKQVLEQLDRSGPAQDDIVDEATTDALEEEIMADVLEETPVELGPESPEEDTVEDGDIALSPKLEGEEVEALKVQVLEAIKTIFDPEIPVNIYELGLIYGVDVHEGNTIHVTMTLTSPNCPAAQSLPAEVRVKSESIDGVQSADVSIVWDPVWGPHLMTEAARLELNL